MCMARSDVIMALGLRRSLSQFFHHYLVLVRDFVAIGKAMMLIFYVFLSRHVEFFEHFSDSLNLKMCSSIHENKNSWFS